MQGDGYDSADAVTMILGEVLWHKNADNDSGTVTSNNGNIDI